MKSLYNMERCMLLKKRLKSLKGNVVELEFFVFIFIFFSAFFSLIERKGWGQQKVKWWLSGCAGEGSGELLFHGCHFSVWEDEKVVMPQNCTHKNWLNPGWCDSVDWASPGNRKVACLILRAHSWVVGHVPSWGCAKGNRSIFLSHIDVSLPVSENK